MDKAAVFICDQREIFVAGLKLLFERENLEYGGHAGHSSDVLTGLAGIVQKVRVVLINQDLPGTGGLALIPQIKNANPDIAIILLSDTHSLELAHNALSAGANGVCLKECTSKQLILSIKAALAGGIWLAPDIGAPLLKKVASGKPFGDSSANPANSASTKLDLLSPRETEVIQLAARGLTNRQIAEELSVSKDTVKTHLQNIMKKLNASDRTQAVITALKCNFVA